MLAEDPDIGQSGAIALAAMNRGIYPGIEVPAALTVKDTWKLVETSEKTGIPLIARELI